MRKVITLASASAALASCNFAPQYRQPVAPIPAHYQPSSSGVQAAGDVGWQDFFADPRLKAYITLALQRNRDLAQATARIAAARAQYRIQDSQRLPQIGIQGSATRTRVPLNSLGFGDALTGAGETADQPTSTTFDQFNLGVAVPSFELDFWGRVRNLSDAARARYLGTIEAQRAFRLSLIGQVAATYLTIASGEERIALAERTLASRTEGTHIARRRMESGVTSSIDYEQALVLQTQAETELADLRRTVEQQHNLLTMLIGGPVEGEVPRGGSVLDEKQFRQIDAGLPSALLANRPDVLQAEFALRAANADIGAARAAFFPNIALTGNYGWASTDLSDLFKGSVQNWSFGGALDLPIFDWGRRSAQVRVNRARAEELSAAYQGAVQQAFREVSDALVGRQRYAEQIVAQDKAVLAQRRLARTARLRYDNGIAIYLEVLDADRNLFAAEQQLLALRAAELQNAVSLYVALGGDTKGAAQPAQNEG